ncbi:MAG: endonuclease [Flavobacteriales bacterium]|nr:MAG: endonuclease [Flavobacteriales bacterium]
MQHNYFVYITTNPDKTVLYISITNDLKRRLFEHQENKGKSDTFAGEFYCYKLIYFEHFSNIEHAIAREKQIKNWSRKKKEYIINLKNPSWNFLNDEIFSL